MVVPDRLEEAVPTEGEPVSEFRDEGSIARALPMVKRYTDLFSPEVVGVENIPVDGPVLVVGNHSGLFYMPDMWVTARAIVDRRGPEKPAYGLAYDFLLAIPAVGDALRRLGAIPADPAAAEAALRHGDLVLVYPGGDREACRPWTERGRIEFGERTGFVRLALRAGVPVVPVVAHGAHDTVVVVSRGERVARVLGLNRLRIKVFPVLFGPPWGLTTVLVPPLPLPAAITVEFLPAIDWSGLGREAADDPEAVGACLDEVVETMQRALDRLHDADPHPLRRGVARLAGRLVGVAPRVVPLRRRSGATSPYGDRDPSPPDPARTSGSSLARCTRPPGDRHG